ncbi:uncharacterized protein LOC111043220 [Nilaparvata lugens]|uniref:uncharacterized protein LOC111043220 n=1 Tax=Nilaparvata lugens TaxID=108931 RepID=UPI00193DB029|nr:uncharacterized protein LOC111043220 [Nilaparvata lugens]
MRLLGLFLLLSSNWQSQTSAATDDPEKNCPCLPPRLCPRIFGQSPIDSKQFGQLPDCTDLTTVRCCGASLTVITEHLGTTKYDDDYLRHGKSPVYIPAKINPVPIPENVMRQVEQLGTADEKKLNTQETSSTVTQETNNPVHNAIEDGKKLILIEKAITSNDVTTSIPTTTLDSTTLKVEARKCNACDQSDASTGSPSTGEFTTTEKYISVNNNEMDKSSDGIILDGKTREQVESTTVMFGESSDPSSTTILSDISATTDSADIEKGKIDGSSKIDAVKDPNQTTGSSEPVAIVNSQPYNVKTMRNLEMPREVYIILPNEETGRMVYENVTDDVNRNETSSGTDQSNEIHETDDDQIQNATNRQEIIEKHLDSIVFQSWENETESLTTEKNVSADEVVEEDTSKGLPETTTEAKSKRPHIRHNLYTRKPNSSILSRNKITEVTSSTTPSTTTTSATKKNTVVTKKDESTIRREEIERISNMTRDQLASGSEYVPVVVRKLPPPPQFKEPTRARTESRVEEDESEAPPVRVPHFRHPPRVLKPVTTTKQPPVIQTEEYDDEEVVEEGEETNNDEVVLDEEGAKLVRTPQRTRQQLIPRSRGGSLFKKPAVEEDKSVDTSEEERVVAMHEFKKIRGQSKFRHPVIESKPSTEPTLVMREVVTEETKSVKIDKAMEKHISLPRARVRTSAKTETATIPDVTTVLPVITTTFLPTTSARNLNVDEEISSTTTQAPLIYQDDDTQDETLLETMEPRISDTVHSKTQQVKPIELYEGKRLNPIVRNHNQEAHTGRRLVEKKKKNLENVTDKSTNSEDKVVVPEVHTVRKVTTTTRRPIVVAPIPNNSASLENVDKTQVTKSGDKPSITDEINDKETRQQNSGLQPINRQRLRNNRPKVAPKTPQPVTNADEGTQTVNAQKEQAAQTTEPPPQQKSHIANFRGNFLRTRNRIGMIENIIKDQMLMEHAALKSRMLRNAVSSGKESADAIIGHQHDIKVDEVEQSRGGVDTDVEPVKNDGQTSSDQDLESEGSEPRLENRQVPIGFNPPTRMERGFVPIVGENLRSTSAFTEDGVPVKQLLLPEESKPPPSFNEVQPQTFQNSLKVIGPLPTGFSHETLRSTSALTEDGIPVSQFQLPDQLKPAESFTENHSLSENRNSKSLPQSNVEVVRINQLELPTELIPPQTFAEVQGSQKHAEEIRHEILQKDPIITKRTLTELVPPVLEAIFFRRTYDDTLVEYNQALMKYNDYINTFLQQHPLNTRVHGVKSV